MKNKRKITLLMIFLMAMMVSGFKHFRSNVNMNPTAKDQMDTLKYGDLSNGYYRNPVLIGNIGDMAVIRVDRDYYMVCSSEGSPILWHSGDLVNWEPLKRLLPSYKGGMGAPDFIKYKDLYYIYFLTGGAFRVMVAPNPKGPWSEPVNLGVQMRVPEDPSTRYNTEGLIDASHLTGPDGRRYLIFSGGYSVELSADGLKAITTPKKIYKGWPIPDTFDIECFCPEGGNIIQLNDYYYLTTAQGGTSGPPTSHMAVSARSRSPQGPWENSPYNPIVHTASAEEPLWSQGQGVLVDTPEGDWYMLYHAYIRDRYNIGRTMNMVPIEWTKDEWFRVPEGIKTGEPIRKPKGGIAVRHGFTLTDDFKGPDLDLKWRLAREMYRFVPEGLALKAKGTKLKESSPMLMPSVYPDYEFTAELTVPDGTEGGLTVWYNQQANVGVGLKDGWVTTYNRDQLFPTWDREKYEGNHVFLRMVFHNNTVAAYYSDKGTEWNKVNVVAEVSGFQHNILTGFGSLSLGIFAAGDGEVIVHHFSIRPL